MTLTTVENKSNINNFVHFWDFYFFLDKAMIIPYDYRI